MRGCLWQGLQSAVNDSPLNECLRLAVSALCMLYMTVTGQSGLLCLVRCALALNDWKQSLGSSCSWEQSACIPWLVAGTHPLSKYSWLVAL